MENFIIALEVISPIFLLLMLGYALKCWGLFQKEFSKQLNDLVFLIFLPCMLFNNIYQFDVVSVFSFDLVVLSVGSLLLLVGILCIIVPKVVKVPAQQGVIIQGIYRSNYVIFGTTLVANMYGSEKAVMASLLSAIIVPFYNFFAVVILTRFTSGKSIDLKKTALEIAKNPLIWAVILGFSVSILKIQAPKIISSTLSDIAKLATPLSFLILGADFEFKRLKGNMKMASVVVCLKLIIIPLIFIPIAVQMGYQGPELLAIALLFETPIAVSSYTMVKKANADETLAGQLVVLSSIASVVTVFLMIFILKEMQLL